MLDYEWGNKILIAVVIAAGIILVFLNPLQIIDQYNSKQNLDSVVSSTCTSSDVHMAPYKVAIITFDDSRKSQYLYAAPILDKCNFKATFFSVCNYLGQDSTRMTWDDISALQKDGQDIESHTMNHLDLTKMSLAQLDYEIGGSQKCLADHHISATVFASPYGNSWNNKTVIDTVSKYYSLGRDGYSPTMFLHCDGWKPFTNQTDCSTYSDNGKLNFASRYSIRAWDNNYYDILYSHDDSKTFNVFVNEVNLDNVLNEGGGVKAIPIIAYHNVDYKSSDYNTDVSLFAKEMNYLHDNGFRVVTMAELGYDKSSNTLYIK